jgi:hypothetical protein
MIELMKNRIRQRIAMVKSCKILGSSSPELRKILFSSFIMPLFTWMHGIFPLFTDRQRDEWGLFYYTALKRSLGVCTCCNTMFAKLYNEQHLEYHCSRYWTRYRKAIAGTTDEIILFEQASLNLYRKLWLEKEIIVKHLRRSKRFVPFETSIAKCLRGSEIHPPCIAVLLDDVDINLLREFPESFL